MEHLIDIPGRLHSVAVEKHIAGTDQIYDDILKTTLDILNLENITDVKVQDGKLLFLNIQELVLKEISIASAEQKQSDWNLTDSTQVDFIKGKPTIYNKLEVDNKLTTKQDTIDDLTTIRSGAQAGASAVQRSDLDVYTKQVASEISHEQKYTGRHTITETIHQVIYPTNNYRKTEMQPEWIRVVDARGENVKSIRMYFDDDYNPQIETLDDKAVWQNTATQQIPVATSETNGLMSASDKSKLDALPTNEQLTQELGDKANSADLAEVATSGSYNDLSDKPTIPAAQVQSDWNESDTTSKAYIKNKPTIPTVPTNVSAFNNDAGYITASYVAAKQDKMSIVQVPSGSSSIVAAVNTYYKVEDAVNDLAITLPTPTDTSKIAMVVISLLAGTTPNVVIGSTAVIDYSAAYDISAGNEYEINCLFNGDKWIVADMEVL